MKLAVDMHVLEGPPQGSRRYLEGLYGALLEMPRDRVDEIEFWVGHIDPAMGRAFSQPVQWRSYGVEGRLLRLFWAASRLAGVSQPDWVHFQYVLPWKRSSREIVTIHDILFETHPEHFPLVQRWALKWLVRRAARRADLVLTDSEYSKSMISTRYEIPDWKIRVTPCGVDFTRFHPEGRKESIQRVAVHYRVRDYLVTVGRLDIRKNLINLLSAYAHLKTRRTDLPKLLVIGPRGNAHTQVMSSIHALGLQGDVIHLDGVTDDLLADIYRGAQGFIMPSFAEGFGIPVIEAMACGCPVASSTGTALGELIYPSRGFPFDPSRLDEIEGALEYLCQVNRDHPSISQAQAFVSAFTWQQCATQFLEGLASSRLNPASH